MVKDQKFVINKILITRNLSVCHPKVGAESKIGSFPENWVKVNQFTSLAALSLNFVDL